MYVCKQHHAYTIECFCESEWLSWVYSFCLVLIWELFKGNESQGAKSSESIGEDQSFDVYEYWKQSKEKWTVNGNVNVVLFIIHYGDTALLGTENKIIFWGKNRLPINHPEGNTVGGSLQNGLCDSNLWVCTPFIIPTCCVWAALSDSFLLKAMRWTWSCDWETRLYKAVWHFFLSLPFSLLVSHEGP